MLRPFCRDILSSNPGRSRRRFSAERWQSLERNYFGTCSTDAANRHAASSSDACVGGGSQHPALNLADRIVAPTDSTLTH